MYDTEQYAITTTERLLRLEALNDLFAEIETISTIPGVVLEILAIAENEISCAEDLLQIIERDRPLAARILRMVNSTRYGLPVPIRNLKSAVTLLGFCQVRDIALTAHLARQFSEQDAYQRYSRSKLWIHLVTVGKIARLVARACHVQREGEVYLAGLLHDIGYLLIDQYRRKAFQTVLDQLTSQIATSRVEANVLQFTHAELGEFVAWKWGFPEAVAIAIGFHHQPQQYHGPHTELLNVVTVANYFASRRKITSLGVQNVEPLADVVLQGLGLRREELTIILRGLEDVVEEARALAISC